MALLQLLSSRTVLHIDDDLVPEWHALNKKWHNCQLCPLHKTRSRIVHFRGYLPCDVLFIGEAPGDSENALGFPFIGPAGDLLDSLIDRAADQAGSFAATPNPSLEDVFKGAPNGVFRVGVTNVVACRPKTEPTGYSSGSIRPPEKAEALACQPRLLEIIKLANPKLIVCLGKIAERYVEAEHLGNIQELTNLTRIMELIHPSAILRAEDSRQPILEKRFVLTLADALGEL